MIICKNYWNPLVTASKERKYAGEWQFVHWEVLLSN